jgi:hypothetical protein
MDFDLNDWIKEAAQVQSIRDALINRPLIPFRGNEADFDAAKRVVLASVSGQAISREANEWAYYRMTAYIMVKYTGLTYFDLCGIAPLPDHLIIENVAINQWIDEAQAHQMKKRR